VSDTGIGMDKETQTRIFEPFFTTKKSGEGTGLGLSTVYGIIKQSGGHIWVYSEPGQGTTFKVYLPRVEDGATSRPSQDAVDSADLEGSETVLVVEDDETVRKLVERMLQEHGYGVLGARRGEEALQLCVQHEGGIDLLLTDMVMPGMNGRELSERLTTLRPELKVLYMSGYADRAINRRDLITPETPFLQKPFSPEELLRQVRQILEHP